MTFKDRLLGNNLNSFWGWFRSIGRRKSWILIAKWKFNGIHRVRLQIESAHNVTEAVSIQLHSIPFFIECVRRRLFNFALSHPHSSINPCIVLFKWQYLSCWDCDLWLGTNKGRNKELPALLLSSVNRKSSFPSLLLLHIHLLAPLVPRFLSLVSRAPN